MKLVAAYLQKQYDQNTYASHYFRRVLPLSNHCMAAPFVKDTDFIKVLKG